MTRVAAATFIWSLGDDAALLPRTPAIAEAFHGLLRANRERLARWDPGVLPDPLTLESTRARLERDVHAWLAGTRLPVAIAIRQDRNWYLVGGASLRLTGRGTAELGYWIDEEFEGRGLVTRTVTTLLDHAFDTLGLRHVTIATDTANQRSRALAHRLGFTQEGRLQEAGPAPTGRGGEIIYGLLASEWNN